MDVCFYKAHLSLLIPEFSLFHQREHVIQQKMLDDLALLGIYDIEYQGNVPLPAQTQCKFHLISSFARLPIFEKNYTPIPEETIPKIPPIFPNLIRKTRYGEAILLTNYSPHCLYQSKNLTKISYRDGS